MDSPDQSNSISVRPRYRRETKLQKDEVIQLIIEGLMGKGNVRGSTLMNHAYLQIPEEEQHYWSPEFHVTIEELDDGALVRGVVGPKPKIWTMFMFFYSGIGTLLFLGLAIGYSQWSLGMQADWLWSVPACLVLGIITYIAARFGRKKAKAQTQRLWHFLDTVVDKGEAR